MSSAPQDPRIPCPAVEQVTLYIKGEYRRSSLYTALGLTTAVVMAFALRRGQPGASMIALVVPWSLLVAGAFLLWSYVQTWRLRIDGTGLARRRLGMWSCWTWHSFADGHVRVGDSPLSFSYSARPWWDRWLILEFGEPDAAATKLANLLRSLIPPLPAGWNPARAIVVPAEVTIGLGFSGQLQFTVRGIEFRHRRQLRWVDWEHVETLRLIREQVNRAIATRLDLRLRGGESILDGVHSVRIDGRRIWAAGERNARKLRETEAETSQLTCFGSAWSATAVPDVGRAER